MSLKDKAPAAAAGARAESGFSTCGNKGFHLRFPNGLVLSTQFGGGNYCENRDHRIADASDKKSENAEVAVFEAGKRGAWRTKEIALAAGLEDPGDDVMGWVSFDDWLKLLDACRVAKAKP